jgi:membrane protein implicated in regulation of membrane protease activity
MFKKRQNKIITGGDLYMSKDVSTYIDGFLNLLIMLALVGGTTSLVFVFINNVTTSMTGSPLAGLFTAGILSLVYSVTIFLLLYRMMKKMGGHSSK